MKSKLQTFKVYSDNHSVVLLEDEDHVVWMSKTSQGDKFDLLKGIRAAWVRHLFRWEHPQTKVYLGFLPGDNTKVGTLVSTNIPTLAIEDKTYEDIPHWLAVDFYAQIPLTKGEMVFIPA